ncbi:MAG: hypothetical protein GX547_16325 [Phycisphaerae bacterium]|nr:hypothetical protein [Phycisphaerae bacterium]
MTSQAQLARVELLQRRRACPARVLYALRLARRLTAPQLARVFRGRWHPATIRQALDRLRLAGCVRQTNDYYHRARVWEIC